MDISIIIVNYNVRHFLKRTIESILQCDTSELQYEIFVVDNDSIDGSVEMVKHDFPDIHVIANADNVGFSKANNQAIRKAQGEYILVLNPDTVIQEDTLKVCYKYMENHPLVGALGVKMIDGSGNFLPESKRALPGAWNSFTKLSGLASIFPNSSVFNGYALGHLDPNQQHAIEVLCGAFMFIRKTTIDKVGMLDERFFMYGEDIDWSKRIIEGGYEIHYIPDTTIIHYKGESTKKASWSYVKTFYNAMILYVEKHYTGRQGRLFAQFLKFAIHARAVISGIKRFVLASLLPALDILLIGLGMYFFSKLWAEFYHQQPGYYNQRILKLNLIPAALIWGTSLWFLGYYQKSDFKNRLQGAFTGILIVLAVYALLPENLRSSRAILLSGFIITLLVTTLTGWLFTSKNKAIKKKKILIVALKEKAEEIRQLLLKNDIPHEFAGTIFPSKETYSSLDYINNLEHLDQVSEVMKIDEVIFNTEDMSMKDIMKTMMQLNSKLSFKIAGDDSLSIIGSDSKNTSGELYTFDVKYNLNESYYRHIKRSFDFLSSLVLLVLFPILLLFNKFRILQLVSNILGVLVGKKTWVGYAGNPADYQTLPPLKNNVLPILFDITKAKKNNIDYARNYNVWQDVETVIKNMNKLT